jgi:hypothetical protein
MSLSAHKVEIIELGDGLGFVLPDDLVSEWNLSEGAVLAAMATEGGFLLAPELPTARPDIR